MATAGYLTTLYVSGTSTSMVGEAVVELVPGPPQIFRIVDAGTRVLDPEVGINISDNGIDVTPLFTVDYLTGIITSETGGYDPLNITVDGAFLPLLPVAEGRSGSANPARAELDTSIFGEAFTRAILGKKSAAGDIATLAPLEQDLDDSGDTRSWNDVFLGATQVLIEIRFTPSSALRAWVLTPTIPTKSDQAGLVESTITWKSIDVRATDGTECGFSVFDPT